MHRQRVRAFRLAVGLVIVALICVALMVTRGGAGVFASRVFAQGKAPNLPCQTGHLCSPWQVTPGPTVSSVNDALTGVAAVSSTDVWAVGCQDSTQYFDCYGNGQTLAEQWNGRAWSVVATPNATSADGLLGVAAITATNVWAVGVSQASGVNQPLVEHWTGSSWAIVSTPADGMQPSYLNAVAASSANDVWAVGVISTPQLDQPLVEHWNGTAWSIVSVAGVTGDENYLTGVTALSATNAWAVGYSYTGGSYPTLVEHWDGTAWSIVASPSPSAITNHLSSVSATSASDVWAIGFVSTAQNGDNTLIEHWNGSAWSVVASPNGASNQNALYGVTALSATNAWAVGNDNTATADQTLIEHWNGVTWSISASPNVGASNNILQSVSAVSARQVWTVGAYGVTPSSSDTDTLAEQLSPFQVL